MVCICKMPSIWYRQDVVQMLVNKVVLSYYSQTSHALVCNCICHVNHNYNHTCIIHDKVNVIWLNYHHAKLHAWSLRRLSLTFRSNRKMRCVDIDHANDLCIAHQYIDAWSFFYTKKRFGIYTPLLCGVLRVDTIGREIPAGGWCDRSNDECPSTQLYVVESRWRH